MIREVIRPMQSDLHIKIPLEYIDREIEFIMFPLDEGFATQNVESPSADLLGGILNKYADLSKIDLEEKAWELHVMDKYK